MKRVEKPTPHIDEMNSMFEYRVELTPEEQAVWDGPIGPEKAALAAEIKATQEGPETKFAVEMTKLRDRLAAELVAELRKQLTAKLHAAESKAADWKAAEWVARWRIQLKAADMLVAGHPMPFGTFKAVDEIATDPLSDIGFAFRLYETVDDLLATDDPDEKLFLAWQIGSLTAQREARRHLPEVRTGKKVRRGAADGGEMRRDSLADDTNQRLAEMDRLIRDRPELGVSWAADQAFKKGFGPSVKANRALFYRHNAK